MTKLFKPLLVAGLSLAAAAPAQAQTLVERFDEPFAGWETRFFGTQSNAQNYYRTEPSGAPADFRGGNIDGLWVSDGDNYTFPGYNGNVNIRFNEDFGEDVSFFSMDVVSLLGNQFGATPATLIYYDIDGAVLASWVLPQGTITPSGNPEGYLNYSVSSTNGFGGFDLLGYAQGNVSVDNVTATVPEPTTWAMMIGGLGVVGGSLRRRRQAALA